MVLIDLARRPDAGVHVASIRDRKHDTRTKLPADRILGYRDAERR